MNIPEQIEFLIESEVNRRVAEKMAAMTPKLILPVPVEPPQNGFEPVRQGGDAAQAVGTFFDVYMRREANSVKLVIQCPTFLRRRGLGIRVENLQGLSY